MTFRIASSKHRGQQGRWDHPGTSPVNIFDESVEWARRHWEEKVAPAVLAKLSVSVT